MRSRSATPDEAPRDPKLFNRSDGLAAPSVTICDPAVGTGTFLLGVLLSIVLWVIAAQLFASWLSITDYSRFYAGRTQIMSALVFFQVSAIIVILGAELNRRLVEVKRRRAALDEYDGAGAPAPPSSESYGGWGATDKLEQPRLVGRTVIPTMGDRRVATKFRPLLGSDSPWVRFSTSARVSIRTEVGKRSNVG